MTAVANVWAGARERDGLPAGFKDDDWKIVGMPIGCRMTSSAWWNGQADSGGFKVRTPFSYSLCVEADFLFLFSLTWKGEANRFRRELRPPGTLASGLLVPNLISTVVNTRKGGWRCWLVRLDCGGANRAKKGRDFQAPPLITWFGVPFSFFLRLKRSSMEKSGTALMKLRTASEGEWVPTRTWGPLPYRNFGLYVSNPCLSIVHVAWHCFRLPFFTPFLQRILLSKYLWFQSLQFLAYKHLNMSYVPRDPGAALNSNSRDSTQNTWGCKGCKHLIFFAKNKSSSLDYIYMKTPWNWPRYCPHRECPSPISHYSCNS